MTEGPSLPDEVRAALPPAAQAYIVFLETWVSLLQGELSTLRAELVTVRSTLAEDRARARQHSGNSSRPPSADPPDAPPRPPRPATGRQRGAQPGHPGRSRELLPSSQVDEIIAHRPQQCPGCQSPLAADLPAPGEPLRQQVWDLPPVRPRVTEHRYYHVLCPQCHTLVPPPGEPGLPPGAFGPSVTALVGLLHGRYRLSMRESAALLEDLFALPISVGSVPELCRQVAEALAQPYAQAQAAVSGGARANVDETGWKQAGQRRWLWVAVGAVCTLFVVATTRSAAALRALLGGDFQGIVGSDRFRAYLVLPVERRQVCWAHLKRNWVAFGERAGPVGEWAGQGLALVERLFAAWDQFRAGQVDRAGLQAAVGPVQTEMRVLLERGCALALDKARAFSHDLLVLWPALWTFLSAEGVEPTNNAAERALRPAVLWRKGCFGAHSHAGNLFVARILTVSATCRQQQCHLLTFLTEAVRAHWARLPAPTLVSTP